MHGGANGAHGDLEWFNFPGLTLAALSCPAVFNFHFIFARYYYFGATDHTLLSHLPLGNASFPDGVSANAE